MSLSVFLPALTAILAFVFAASSTSGWSGGAYQLVWAFGMLFFGIAAGCEALAAARLERAALPDLVPDRRGLDGRLARARDGVPARADRFGYAFALCLFLAGLFTFLTCATARIRQRRAVAPILYFIAAGILALAVGVETYFQNERWPRIAASPWSARRCCRSSSCSTTRCRRPATRSTRRPARRRDLFPALRLLTPFMNVTGAFALILGACSRPTCSCPSGAVLDLFARPEPAGRLVPVQPADRAVRDRRRLRRLAPRWRSGRSSRPDPQPRPGDRADRHRGLHPDVTDSLNRLGATQYPAGQAPRRRLPVRRLPRLDRGLPRNPHPVHPIRRGRRGRRRRRRGSNRLHQPVRSSTRRSAGSGGEAGSETC